MYLQTCYAYIEYPVFCKCSCYESPTQTPNPGKKVVKYIYFLRISRMKHVSWQTKCSHQETKQLESLCPSLCLKALLISSDSI